MKLYYDTLVMYMPDTIINEAGESEHDDAKEAGRRAMMELSNFQITGNLISLYQSIIYACKYAGKDLIDTILNIPDDIIVPEQYTAGNLLDEAVKLLFKSINPENPFDLNAFVAYVSTASHIIFVNIQNSQKQDTAEETK